jgi:hypothetical protein
MVMAAASSKCAFKPCKCNVDPSAEVQREGKAYCSNRCVDGRGCDHAGCNCGAFPTAEPDPARVP